jgi:hypothetical protein
MNMIAEEQKVWLLDATDRCDRCQAQAYIKVIGSAGELLFCSHHYNKVMDDPKGYESMMKFMVEVIDERAKLEE